MEYQWNTGRLYQANGQIIKAIQIDTGEVLFADLSRGIDGVLPDPGFALDSLNVMRTYVMGCYDHNAYKADSRSWTFHMKAR